MKIDPTRFKQTLPYASKLFVIYQPLLGWQLKRIIQRVQLGFLSSVEPALRQSAANGEALATRTVARSAIDSVAMAQMRRFVDPMESFDPKWCLHPFPADNLPDWCRHQVRSS